MFLRCIDVMASDLERTMIDIKSHPDALDIREYEPHRVDLVFTPSLQYACKFWAEHLLRTNPSDFERVRSRLGEFSTRFLSCWLGAMDWLGLMDDATMNVKEVMKWMVCSPHAF